MFSLRIKAVMQSLTVTPNPHLPPPTFCLVCSHWNYQQTTKFSITVYLCTFYIGGTWWRSWLRHCDTSRKVAGSIPDGVIGIFHWHNPSVRTMALWLTQPLTEMSIRSISFGYRRPVRRADNLTTFKCQLSWNLGASNSWNPQGLSRPIMGLLYLCTFYIESSPEDTL
jgi:hypothetical protein